MVLTYQIESEPCNMLSKTSSPQWGLFESEESMYIHIPSLLHIETDFFNEADSRQYTYLSLEEQKMFSQALRDSVNILK